jgi:hypothetical protein
MEIIKNFDKLDLWLKENNYFEDGLLIRIDHNPLVLTVGYDIYGNYKANTERRIRSFKITPSKIMESNVVPHNFLPPGYHYLDFIEPFVVEKGICLQFQFMWNPMLSLAAESLSISEPETIVTTFKPWLSTNNIYIQAPMDQIPAPSFWKSKLHEVGHEIVFRYYCGPPKLPEQLPYPDYSGYFIQLADRVGETKDGICIEHLSMENHQVSLSFSKTDKSLDRLWIDLSAILADFPQVKINCGNSELTGAEWKQLLKNRLYPPVF